jgi:hypothetical protein
MTEYTINLHYDREAAVWYSRSDDIPGLNLCDPSIDALITESENGAIELLELMGVSAHNVRLTFKVEYSKVAA